MEEWKIIENCSKYEISNFGNIRNRVTNMMLQTAIERYGYEKIQLVKDNGCRLYTTIHRLVAKAWVYNDDPVNKLQVNHKDGIKTNNKYSNLEWMTSKENINHAYENNLFLNLTGVILVDLSNDSVVNFRSIKMLSNFLGISPSIICPLIKNSDSNPIFDMIQEIIKNIFDSYI